MRPGQSSAVVSQNRHLCPLGPRVRDIADHVRYDPAQVPGDSGDLADYRVQIQDRLARLG